MSVVLADEQRHDVDDIELGLHLRGKIVHGS
jgi:hypothetical protein